MGGGGEVMIVHIRNDTNIQLTVYLEEVVVAFPVPVSS